MQAGTSALKIAAVQDAPQRTWRQLSLVVAVASAVLVAGCASRTAPAPITDLSGAPAAGQPAPVAAPDSDATYTVVQGDTLYKIAHAKGVDVSTLIRLNNITDPSQLRIGQVLRLGGQAVAVAQPVKPVAPVEPTPSTEPASTAPAAPAAPAASGATSSVPRASDANLISWDWPATGRIIQGFNTNTKGIDIEGNLGDPVKAAADGKVMYAGNGVRGLGNLILLGHSDGFITAYAHNQVLLVKTGQQVKKGARIASIGQSDTTSPRLHFEIRRRGTPVNPLSYLPPR